MKKALIVLSLFPCILALAGCGGESALSPATAQKDMTKAVIEPLSIGQSARLDNGLIITVTSARHINRDPKASGVQPELGEVWTVADFTVENSGQSTVTVTPANWTATADVGDILKQVPEAVPDEETSKVDWAGELESGQKREGFIAFITLLSDTVFLEFNQGAGRSSALASWKLGPIRELGTMRL